MRSSLVGVASGPHLPSGKDCTQRRRRLQPPAANVYKLLSQNRTPWPPNLSCPRLRCRINTQHFHELSDLAQVAQRMASGFVIATEYLGKKNVFPRPSPHGTRLDLAEADLT